MGLKIFKSVIILLILGNLSFCFAQSSASAAGLSSALFLRSAVSTRVAGLGEAYVAVADDENSLLYNPAGLARIIRPAFALNHTEWLEDIRFANLIYVQNIADGLGIGISLSHMYMPGISRIIDADGTEDGTIDVSTSIATIGAGYNLFRGFYIGTGIKYFHDNLAGYTADGVAFDAGFYSYTFLKGLTLGAAVQNVGAEIKYVKESYKIPFTYRAGLAYKLTNMPLQIALDMVKSQDSEYNFNLGCEYTFDQKYYLQVGNQLRTDSYFTPTFGAGLTYDNQYSLYYAFSVPSEIGFSHRIGLKFEFGSITSPKYVSPSVKLSAIPPSNLTAKISNGNLFISWGSVPNATYNVYAKGAQNKWVKLTKSPIDDNYLVLKNPKKGKKYTFTVTTIKNDIESPYAKETIIYVKN